eukprot:TRINITY_DN6088_c0_g1_i1.p1 TRINITY_DN6088_c0_g1~~TRINITY_DN6088_c0_g1_i1.p1  ORF type:complete len:130 (+),score=1.22 TRINITY_DN6088_c0_g1_i1:2-391(+)
MGFQNIRLIRIATLILAMYATFWIYYICCIALKKAKRMLFFGLTSFLAIGYSGLIVFSHYLLLCEKLESAPYLYCACWLAVGHGYFTVTVLFLAGGIRVALNHLVSQPCLLYTSPSPRDLSTSRMPSSA